MTLRSRLAFGLLAIAVILVTPLVFAVRSLEALHRDIRNLRNVEFTASLALGQLREELNDLRARETALLFVHTAAAHDAMARGMTAVSALADTLERSGIGKPAQDIREAVLGMATWAPYEYQAALADKKN